MTDILWPANLEGEGWVGRRGHDSRQGHRTLVLRGRGGGHGWGQHCALPLQDASQVGVGGGQLAALFLGWDLIHPGLVICYLRRGAGGARVRRLGVSCRAPRWDTGGGRSQCWAAPQLQPGGWEGKRKPRELSEPSTQG